MLTQHLRAAACASLLLLVAAGFSSCSSDPSLAYIGKWSDSDSTLYYTPDSVVIKTTLTLKESSYSWSVAKQTDTSERYYEQLLQQGDLRALAENMSFAPQAVSYIPENGTALETVTKADAGFKDKLAELKLDTLISYKFNVIRNKIVLKKGNSEIAFTRE